MSDERPCLYVDAAVNPDEVRTYYELPEALIEGIRAGVGGGETDTFTFDQALSAFTDEITRAAQMLNDANDELLGPFDG